MRFSHPIVAARRAKPAMENQSGAVVFGADGGNRFLVALWAVAAASGIVVTSQRHSLASSKSVSGSARSEKFVLGFESRPLASGGSTGVSLSQRQPR